MDLPPPSVQYQLDTLRGQVRQIQENESGMRAQIGSLLEISKQLLVDRTVMQQEIAKLQGDLTGVVAAIAPEVRLHEDWQPKYPPPGYLRRELAGILKNIDRIKRHLDLGPVNPMTSDPSSSHATKKARTG